MIHEHSFSEKCPKEERTEIHNVLNVTTLKVGKKYILKIFRVTVTINNLHVFRAKHNYNVLVCGVPFFFFFVRSKITSRYSA